MRAAQLSNARPVWVLLWPKDLLYWNEFDLAKKMLVSIVAMLTKLVEPFDPYQYRVRESAQA